jgi:hypothetical protein
MVSGIKKSRTVEHARWFYVRTAKSCPRAPSCRRALYDTGHTIGVARRGKVLPLCARADRPEASPTARWSPHRFTAAERGSQCGSIRFLRSAV